MAFHPFEVTIPHVAYALLGGFVVIFGMFSLLIREKLYIGEACLAFLFGVIIGPYGAGVFDPRHWGGGSEEVSNAITLEFTRVVLAIGVFAIGVELPKAYMAKHWKSLFYLLFPCMTWGWFVSAGLIYALVPGLNFLSSLAVAACLTPTDPILAAAVVGGKYADKHVPAHLRHLLAAESGCNDGAAFPFLYISLYLILDKSTGRAISDWFLLLWLYQVILGIVMGALIGYGFRHLMKFCERKDLIDRQSYVAQYVSLAILTIGVCTLLGSDDLLAAFSCGTAFAWDGFFNKQTEDSVFSSVVDLLFNVAAFIFVGAWMPFNQFSNEDLTLSVWRLIVIGILILLLRRLPIIIALYKFIPDVKTFREAIFSGHFGPMGIGAVFISTLAAEQLPRPEGAPETQSELLQASIQPIVAFMVLCSVAVHGLSIPFFSLGRRVRSVSRTWSRRDTLSSAPEWTHQTRRIERGQEIVINRDSAMERGESVTPVDDEKLARRRESGTPEENVVQQRDFAAEKDQSSGETAAEREQEGHTKDEIPPDGDDVIAEWKEGPHKIIERRAGPGEEVEVEVVRNAFESNAEKMTSLYRGRHDIVHQTVEANLSRLRHAQHEVGKSMEKAEENVQHGLHAAEHGMQNAERRAEGVLLPHGESSDQGHDQEQGAEDEGWMSDHSIEIDESSPSHVSFSDRRPRSKSPKQRSPSKTGSSRTGRHRPSGRKGILARPQLLSHNRTQSLGDLGEDHRVLTLDSPTSSRPNTPDIRLPRHSRIQTMRSAAASRDASPARSIRFADDPPSGASTPRGPLSPRSPSTPLASPTSPTTDDDSPKTKVTFDLPNQR
ncbi:hypothetical protein GLOTRDRAFT_61511 [Gloeophyllum trabeum ATCC 11539]|uniref:Cation/H+ exchanger transmembrane domain-containing protein n=1 Tax=Gloeophyllum trabeum (strain ATCC 11539 / FP-39264 / Madison 617) TaxID=670483 RepID=S7Q4J1_GLOTA|nr:uncharacterized protein GLOTRDRAFT_61511 [Gloeophyllum trabeum ATCC 11539]EPQ54422.1 hypothetical protein GLOTRDRAFT_61511 [Gloeophyllum trabeum ATCC 11539]